MLGKITVKTEISWLGYKRLKTMTHVKEALYKNNTLSYNRLKVLRNAEVILVEATLMTYMD